MSQVSFIAESLASLHSSIDDATKGLTDEQAHYRSGSDSNHIAFVAWHYARTVDNIVRFVLQRKPTIWMEGKWDERFGLDSKSQGTGMTREEASALRISDMAAFGEYMSQVWQASREYVGSITEDDLAQKMTIRPLGEMTLGHVLGTVLLTHGYTHLGEIYTLKGIQGLAGSPI